MTWTIKVYHCIGCGRDIDELVSDTEQAPGWIDCPHCGEQAEYAALQVKRNSHRWRHRDV